MVKLGLWWMCIYYLLKIYQQMWDTSFVLIQINLCCCILQRIRAVILQNSMQSLSLILVDFGAYPNAGWQNSQVFLLFRKSWRSKNKRERGGRFKKWRDLLTSFLQKEYQPYLPKILGKYKHCLAKGNNQEIHEKFILFLKGNAWVFMQHLSCVYL